MVKSVALYLFCLIISVSNLTIATEETLKEIPYTPVRCKLICYCKVARTIDQAQWIKCYYVLMWLDQGFGQEEPKAGSIGENRMPSLDWPEERTGITGGGEQTGKSGVFKQESMHALQWGGWPKHAGHTEDGKLVTFSETCCFHSNKKYGGPFKLLVPLYKKTCVIKGIWMFIIRLLIRWQPYVTC